MDLKSLLNAEYADLIIAVIATTAAFTLYYVISGSKAIRLKIIALLGANPNVSWIAFQKIMGGLIFGLSPIAIILIFGIDPVKQFGMGAINPPYNHYLFLLISLLIIPFNLIIGRKSSNYRLYPQMRINEWPASTFLLNVLAWSVYLFGYELIFRGYLLFTCYEIVGYWPAILINVSLYALVHIPKGMKESLAAIPFGLVICIWTLATGNIWPAFITHLILAISNDVAAISGNPEMRFVFRSTKR